jgi:tRNA threonylcarbamoyladenosine biosynthesis protein TsaE
MTTLRFKKNELQSAAKKLKILVENRRKILIYGEMGAGKTTFIGAFCKVLGVQKPTNSPTFSLVNQYFFEKKDGRKEIIHHLDLYRLKNLNEAAEIGIEEILWDDNWTFIEWPQLIEPILPENCVKIKIQAISETERELIFL